MYDDNFDVPLAEMEHVDYTDAYNKSYGTSAFAVHAAGREMLVVWDNSKKGARGPGRRFLSRASPFRARPGRTRTTTRQ